MSFMQKLQAAMAQWMEGRNGADQLGLFVLCVGLLCDVLGVCFGSALLLLLGPVGYFYALFRFLSRNVSKRRDENARFLTLYGRAKTEIRQFFLRLKGMKTYKYFRCPQCGCRLRLKRGCGEKHILCPKCKHAFDKKA